MADFRRDQEQCLPLSRCWPVSESLTMAPTRLHRVEYERPVRPATLYRDLPMHIGEALRRQYKPPEELPDQLLALLTQLAAPVEDN